MLQRAEQIGFAVDICNDKPEGCTKRKFLACKKFQRGGVLVPGTVLFGNALAGWLVEKLNRVYIRKDSNRHTANSGEVNAPRQVSAIDPADSLNSGKYLCGSLHC